MRFDVIVTGGGVVGIAMALSLERCGYNVALIEKARLSLEQPVSDGDQVFMLNSASLFFLEKIGLSAHRLAKRVHAIFEMIVRGDGHGELLFNAASSGMASLGCTIQKSDLHRVLYESLKRSQVAIFDEDTVRHIKWDRSHVELKLEERDSITGDLLIAADGVRSKIRELAKIAVKVHDFDQIAVVSRLTGRPLDGVAYQWFQKSGGVLALLPIGDSDFGVVWSMPRKAAQEVLASDQSFLDQKIRNAIGDDFGDLILSGSIRQFPLNSVTVASVIGKRLALVGDAGGTVHPMAGQGLNLGLGDASILTRILSEKSNASLSSKLRKYQRRRLEKVVIIRNVTHGLHKLFSTDNSFAGCARNVGMSIFDRSLLLKRLAIGIASR